MVKVQTGADVKSQFKPLTEMDIQALTDDASFRKGHDYYLHQAIVEPTLSESVLRAFCHASSGGLYPVEATLAPLREKRARHLVSTHCSCPHGGICKHLVALLLTWLKQPERFVVRTGLMGRLSEKSHEELLTLLDQLVQRQPDIESLVELLTELPLTAIPQKMRPGRGRESTLDPSSIRSQVASAFYNAGEGWGSASRVAVELERLCDIGKVFAEADEWANALVVYSAVAEETLVRYQGLHDEGQVSWMLSQCAAGLVACLRAQPTLPPNEQLDAPAREALLTTLFDLWKFSSHYGGIGVDVAEVLAEQVTVSERKNVETWLRQEMRAGEEVSSKWRNRAVIDFLAILKRTEQFNDEDVLEEYRKVDLHKERAEKLLQLGRENEALGVAQANITEPMDVTWFADQLLQAGELWQESALALVETRLGEVKPAGQGKSQDFTSTRTLDTYRRWLSEKYLLYGRAKQALEMELTRFQANPDETIYRAVRSAAQAADQREALWPELRPQLIRTLEQQGRWGSLVSIYLDEGEVGLALSALAEMERAPKASPYGYGYFPGAAPSHYRTQVAQAAEEHYPDEAIRLYKRVVQTLIDGRGRDNYRQAIEYLTRVRSLYQKQERHSEWQTYMNTLRNSNKNLRALKEELEKRDL